MTNVKLLLTVRIGLAYDTFHTDYIYKDIHNNNSSLQALKLPFLNTYPENYSYGSKFIYIQAVFIRAV
jgi:hypothetical protein